MIPLELEVDGSFVGEKGAHEDAEKYNMLICLFCYSSFQDWQGLRVQEVRRAFTVLLRGTIHDRIP
jgi:hypothetical protein